MNRNIIESLERRELFSATVGTNYTDVATAGHATAFVFHLSTTPPTVRQATGVSEVAVTKFQPQQPTQATKFDSIMQDDR
jgi:hypothetical protein